MSRKVINDEQDLAAVIASVEGCAATVVWAIDIVGAPSALLLSLLAAGERDVRYASGRMVNALSVAFTGEGKKERKKERKTGVSDGLCKWWVSNVKEIDYDHDQVEEGC